MEYRELIPAGMNHLPEYIANLGHIDIINSSFMDMMTDTASWLPVPCEGTVRFLNAKNGYLLDRVMVDPNKPVGKDFRQCRLPMLMPDLSLSIRQFATYSYQDYIAAFRDAVDRYNAGIVKTNNYLRILFVEDQSKDFYLPDSDYFHNAFLDKAIIGILRNAHADIIVWCQLLREKGQDAGRVLVATKADIGSRQGINYRDKRVVAAQLNEVPLEAIEAFIRDARNEPLSFSREKPPASFEELSPAAQKCLDVYARCALYEEHVQDMENTKKKLETCKDPSEWARLHEMYKAQEHGNRMYEFDLLRLYTAAEYLRGAREVQYAVSKGASIGMLVVSAFLASLEDCEDEDNADAH